MSKCRLDQALVMRKLVATRSQAESYIRLGRVVVNKKVVIKPGTFVEDADAVDLLIQEQYVSRAGLKLSSVVAALKLDFDAKVILDVGSSTGGFTDYALQHGARKIVAVDVGTDQLHSSLRDDPRVELHEKTDIRNFRTQEHFDVVLLDLSFISLREVLPYIVGLSSMHTDIVVMVKPQFEARLSNFKHKGVIKNDRLRRTILKDFESWTKERFLILGKADSAVAGEKGNRERFYLLRLAVR